MKQYLDKCEEILANGERRSNRTGVDTISLFGSGPIRFDVRYGLPILTTRKQNFSIAAKEICWILRGESNIKTLGCKVWDEWCREDGSIGPLYGPQLRDFNGSGLDQVSRVIEGLRSDPMSRRHLMTTFNPLQASEGVLWPCHGISIQFNCSKISTKERYQMLNDLTRRQISELPNWDPSELDFEVGESESFIMYSDDGLCDLKGIPKYHLDMHMLMRSNDLCLGAPSNITEYSLLLMLIARAVNMVPRYYYHSASDWHIYVNHLEGLREQLLREPLTLSRVEITNKPLPYPGCPRDGSVLEPEDFKLIGYQYHPAIKYPIAI